MTKTKQILLLILGTVLMMTNMSCHAKGPAVAPVYLTMEELAQYNGLNDRPLYVALDGVIYDLTKCRYWKDGVHTKSSMDAIAGKDLTEVLKKSKHGLKRVQRYPVVGYIKKEDVRTNKL